MPRPSRPRHTHGEIPRMRRARRVLLIAAVAALAYLALWPVPVDPVAWTAPPDAGYVGVFARDSALTRHEAIDIAPHEGPESIARDARGRLYVATAGGTILRLAPDGSGPQVWARTGGRPLGMAFDAGGTLFVADGARGLLAVDTAGAVRLLADHADGVRIAFADDVAVANDGKVYLTDASTKFGGRDLGDEDASVLDIVEHGGHGRLLEWDPATGRATTVMRGLEFANGVAMTADHQGVLLCETGRYRVIRVGVAGAARGSLATVIDELPGFPDNISPAGDGTYWVALFAPRNALLDRLDGWPALRKVLLRIPRAIRPRAAAYGHVVRIDEHGRVLDDRQDPTGALPKTTDVLATETHLYIGSLEGAVVARVPR